MADVWRGLPLVTSLRMARHALLALLTMLLLVQSLGVLHRVAHAHHAVSVASTQVQVSGTANTHEGAALLARLWGEHSSLAECQLFDQLCPDLGLIPTLALLPLLPASGWTASVLQERFALFERFYAARGPPVALI
jgi:hypothetical protein